MFSKRVLMLYLSYLRKSILFSITKLSFVTSYNLVSGIDFPCLNVIKFFKKGKNELVIINAHRVENYNLVISLETYIKYVLET